MDDLHALQEKLALTTNAKEYKALKGQIDELAVSAALTENRGRADALAKAEDAKRAAKAKYDELLSKAATLTESSNGFDEEAFQGLQVYTTSVMQALDAQAEAEAALNQAANLAQQYGFNKPPAPKVGQFGLQPWPGTPFESMGKWAHRAITQMVVLDEKGRFEEFSFDFLKSHNEITF